MAEAKRRYSVSGYCTECGETVAETDGDAIADFIEDLDTRIEWAFQAHVEREHG